MSFDLMTGLAGTSIRHPIKTPGLRGGHLFLSSINSLLYATAVFRTPVFRLVFQERPAASVQWHLITDFLSPPKMAGLVDSGMVLIREDIVVENARCFVGCVDGHRPKLQECGLVKASTRLMVAATPKLATLPLHVANAEE